MTQQPDPIRRPKQAAEILGVSIITVSRLAKAGKLTLIKMSPRTSGILQSDIDRLIADGRQ